MTTVSPSLDIRTEPASTDTACRGAGKLSFAASLMNIRNWQFPFLMGADNRVTALTLNL